MFFSVHPSTSDWETGTFFQQLKPFLESLVSPYPLCVHTHAYTHIHMSLESYFNNTLSAYPNIYPTWARLYAVTDILVYSICICIHTWTQMMHTCLHPTQHAPVHTSVCMPATELCAYLPGSACTKDATLQWRRRSCDILCRAESKSKSAQ